MERVARVLCMCVELIVPFGSVGMLSRMLVLYVDGGVSVCCVVDVKCLF